jgi:hypothetical protein
LPNYSFCPWPDAGISLPTRPGPSLVSERHFWPCFPALERVLDLNNNRGALTLVSHYQTPARLRKTGRKTGRKRLAAYLRNRGLKGAEGVADKALTAARAAQSVTLPAEGVAASIVAELAREVLALKKHIEILDKELRQRFFARPEARIIASLPGMGPLLGAEFLVATGDLCAFDSADQLAAYAGLWSQPPTTPPKGVATTAGCEVGTSFSNEPSTNLPLLACVARLPPEPFTIAKGERARGGTPRL